MQRKTKCFHIFTSGDILFHMTSASEIYIKAVIQVDDLFHRGYIPYMEWEVEYTDQFEEWWETLTEGEQEDVAAVVGLLEIKGPFLPFPYSSDIEGSKFGQMRELRIQHKGEPYRVLYAFDPRRVALLLIGGCKTGDDRWYEKYVPIADKLFTDHLKSLR